MGDKITVFEKKGEREVRIPFSRLLDEMKKIIDEMGLSKEDWSEFEGRFGKVEGRRTFDEFDFSATFTEEWEELADHCPDSECRKEECTYTRYHLVYAGKKCYIVGEVYMYKAPSTFMHRLAVMPLFPK